jgi:BirA family biotin operon repressor/biotin-[acetyl-CoA-carboxylase] ligase
MKPDFSIAHSPFVTMAAAVAVCRAVEKVVGIETSIKWVNDIYYNRKKVCGILTEAQTNMETGVIDRLIIGIGINCFPGSFPPEIAHKAGSLADHIGAFSRSALTAELINQVCSIMNDVEDRSFLTEYRRRCFILGEQIFVHPLSSDKEIPARALAIEDDGGLLVEYLEGENAGSREVLRTGEISIRLHDQENIPRT